MTAPSRQTVLSATILALLIHVSAWLPFFLGVSFLVPMLEKRYAEIPLSVPAVAREPMILFTWMASCRYAILVVLLPLLALDAALCFYLRRTQERQWLSWVWSLLVVVAALGASVFLAAVIFLLLLKITEALAH
jgi:hypothetical protein